MPAENFNAGVLSITPSLEKYLFLLNAVAASPIGWTAEQELLNNLFPLPTGETLESFSYLRTELPMKYNLNLEAYASHRSQWDEIWPDARIVHFTMTKPGFWDPGDRRYDLPLDVWWQEWEEMRTQFGWPSNW
jgi:hypothetical protein